MEITINQKNHQLQEACSVQQMVTILRGAEASGIAVAVNQTVIPKAHWARHLLKPGDEVMLIKATQGG